MPISSATNQVLCSRIPAGGNKFGMVWHNYDELNQDEGISAAGFQGLGERE